MKRVVLALSLVLVVAACGDGEAGDESTTTRPTGAPEFVTVTMDDFSFDPATVTVAAAVMVNVTVENSGGSHHTWTVLTAGDEVTTASGLDPSRVIVTVEADAGQIGTGSVMWSYGPGIYRVICTVSGHLELGMEGTLIVEG
jgi:plastocyanin